MRKFWKWLFQNVVDSLNNCLLISVQQYIYQYALRLFLAFTEQIKIYIYQFIYIVSAFKVKMVLAKLYENKKIASATHNIYAYR